LNPTRPAAPGPGPGEERDTTEPLPELGGLSVAALRELLASTRDEAETRRLCAALAADPRAGARALATRALRRVERERAEAKRMRGLFERRARLVEAGARFVAGVDEVGVGPLAGPVVAAAVVLPEVVDLPGLNDSKKLKREVREQLAASIREQAIGVGIGVVSADEIDRRGILNASLEAMRRAVLQLTDGVPVDHVLVDARTIPGIDLPQTPLIHGDAIDASIAAASIVAKVYRDRIMREYDAAHPGYGFARHMGYGTAEHVGALERIGASPIHRRSFAPVAAVLRS